MHPNPIYRGADDAKNLAFAVAQGFGTLTVSEVGTYPLLAHVPFVVTDRHVDMHLLRSNPIARALGAALPATLAVTGPHSYISPDWYQFPDQVPTWNYIAVHLRGRLSLRPDEELRALLARQSAHFEELLLPKPPWTIAKMSDGVFERMMRAIVPVRLEIAEIDGTWKLNQNKDPDVRLRAADRVEESGTGCDAAALAEAMRRAE